MAVTAPHFNKDSPNSIPSQRRRRDSCEISVVSAIFSDGDILRFTKELHQRFFGERSFKVSGTDETRREQLARLTQQDAWSCWMHATYIGISMHQFMESWACPRAPILCSLLHAATIIAACCFIDKYINFTTNT